MKIIHCADIHLDSPLKRLSTTEKKKERRAELIKAFHNMVDFGAANGVLAILIAGDLFDQSKVSATASSAVLDAIKRNPGIDFYYIKGNHDKNDFLADPSDAPANLRLFTDRWTRYDLGENIVLCGAELTKDNARTIGSELVLDNSNFNIVSLHGQEAESAAKDNAQTIVLKDLRSKGIDYLALGHVHAYKKEELDGRGTYCYPGCLESRGFDETDDHGFMLLDIDGQARTFHATRICMPIRTAHVVKVDISDCMTSGEIRAKVEEKLNAENYPSKDMVKVELTGYVDFACEKDGSVVAKMFEDRYFDFKLKDCSEMKVDYESFKLDESLKGEFVRIVEAADDLDPEEKAEVIRIGIQALKGMEVE